MAPIDIIRNTNSGPMNDIDIRLLSVFDAVYRTRSVTAAAHALDLGQPAVSVALSKLRQHFGNPLFVRTSKAMEPTPFGESLARPVRAVLDAFDLVLGHQNEFNPATSNRSFCICMTDISQLVLLPRLWERLRKAAPHIHIKVVPLSDDAARELENGEVDMALGFMPQLDTGFYQQLLFKQYFVCMVATDHPRIKDHFSLTQFEAEDHARISLSGLAPLIVDREVERLRLNRKIALEIPNYLGASFVVENTDLVITIPQRLADVLLGHGAFRIFPVPFPVPGYDVKLYWHERYHHDEGSRWLRKVIFQLLATS
jgi:DNA-binding transcriptional LysR family regulator